MKSGMRDRTGRRVKGLSGKRLPELLALLLIVGVLGFFVSQKEGYHMDELLSFELSNAAYNPWIVPTQPEGRLAKFLRCEIRGDTFTETLKNLGSTAADVLKNRSGSTLAGYKADVYEEPVWIGAQQFRDYITVDGKDAFQYLSVYFNVKDDNHPPLHFMLLHTISSLFQGKAEPFMGCVINIAAVLGCCALMLWLGALGERGLPLWDRKTGLAAALLYGLSSGAAATTLLIRMYGVMTFFCVALFVIHVKKWRDGGFAGKNGLLIAVTVLGFLSQYFFLFYCLTLALVTAVLLAGRREWGQLLRYVRSMVLAAVIGLAVFPFALSDVFSSGRGVEALGNLKSGLAGYGERLGAFAGIVLKRMFGSAGAGLVFAVAAAAGLAAVLLLRRKGARECNGGLLAMLAVPPLVYFFLAARMSPYLVDRYVMALFPFAAMLLAVGIRRLTAGISGEAVVLAVITAVICMCNVFGYDGEYLYRGYHNQELAAEENRNLSCICVYDGVGYYENLKEFTRYDKTLLVTLKELEDRKETGSVGELEQAAVLIKANVDGESVRRVLEEKYGLRPQRELVTDSVYGDTVWLYSREDEAAGVNSLAVKQQ